jgi:superfamily II DNA helicase RecQ
MRVKIATLPYSSALGGFDDRSLATFLSDKEVIEFRDHFFLVGDAPHLTCIVLYRVSSSSEVPAGAAPDNKQPDSLAQSRTRPDPLHGMNARQRNLFSHMREWRAELARRDGVPPYVVLTNKQLRSVIFGLPDSPASLRNIEGVGAGKVERYGEALLAALHGAPTAPPENTEEFANDAPTPALEESSA